MENHQTGENQNSRMIDFGFLLKILRTNLVRIAVIALICCAGAGVLRYFTTTPTYTSEVTFFVNAVGSTQDGDVRLNVGNTTTARDLTETFSQVIISSGVIDPALDILKNEAVYGDKYNNLTREAIRGMLSVSFDTQIISLSVTNADTAIAYDIAHAVESVTPGVLDYYVGLQNDDDLENVNSVVKVVDNAEPDDTPSGRGILLFGAIGLILGAGVVYLIAFLNAMFDNTVYSEEDLKSSFKNPVIGQIPSWSSGDDIIGKKSKRRASKRPRVSSYTTTKGSNSDRNYKGRLLSKETPFAIAEAFKLLRTNMCYTTKGENCAVYGVTSAYVSAGKSLVIANTAISFAEMGKRVLLVDGDLRCPVQHRIFDLNPKVHGLSEVLAGVCRNRKDAIRPTGIENLDILTSGRIPPNPAELLASERMRAFIEAVKNEYDVVFIDLPPICEVTDAGVISDLVTGYAFVVRAAHSDRRLVNIAMETMESLGASIIGFILNDVDIKSGDYYKNKYYGTYHKYGKYGNYGKYGKYSRAGYGKYGKYGHYGRSVDYRYGYTDAELVENELSRTNADSSGGDKS